ncbi:MAG TPA: hypothetical protein VF777_12490 [Phycisphaerales bacterium]
MEQPDQVREKLARWIVVGSLIVTGAVAITAIATASWAQSTSNLAVQILTLVLPLLGTWVGAVMAYYFARENFESAAKQTRLLLGQKLDSPAIDAAIPAAKIQALTLPQTDNGSGLALSAIRDKLKEIAKYRVPIFDENKAARFVVHRQPLDGFLADRLGQPATPPPMFNDLLDSPEFGKQVQNACAYISKDATLAEAKAAMESRQNCQDVFITEHGRPDEPVIGWLTNNEIQRASEA